MDILLVDGDEARRHARHRLLQDAGLQTIEAMTGAAALRLAVTTRPAVVVLDTQLPDVSGADVCRRLKTSPVTASSLVVLIATAEATVDQKAQGPTEADVCVQEPQQPQAFVTLLKAMLRVRRSEEALRQAHNSFARHVQAHTAELRHTNENLRRQIAEYQRANEAIQARQETLDQHQKLAVMGSLLASVAHELNNPLGALVIHADILKEELGSSPLTTRVDEIARTAERCTAIVQNFLTLARRSPPQRTRVVLNSLVHDALQLLAYSLRMDSVTVHQRLASNLPPLWADPQQLSQALVNLLTNAHYALREISTPRQLTITTRATPQNTVELEIADTGPGIPPEVQTRIFEPFFTTKPPGIGTGLGLPFCRGIIEEHGGTITVESRPGQETVCRVELPIEASVPGPAVDGETAPRPVVEGKTILVVDDEASITRALAHLFQRDGYTVETAANGRIGVTKLRERAFDLILCDLRMPELDGPGFYHELEQHAPHLRHRVIFLTGDTLSPEATAFLERVDAPRLTKPFNAAKVRRAVRRFL